METIFVDFMHSRKESELTNSTRVSFLALWDLKSLQHYDRKVGWTLFLWARQCNFLETWLVHHSVGSKSLKGEDRNIAHITIT